MEILQLTSKLTVNVFPPKIRNKARISNLITIEPLEVLSRSGKKLENKRHQIGKNDVKLFLFADDMIIYVENMQKGN